MTVVNTIEALASLPDGAALAGLVCLGFEEVRAFVEAAEAEATPAILMVGPGARAAMPLEIWGPMLRHAVEGARAPLAIHLDHGRDLDEVKLALDLGFSSVMYDGSLLPFGDNVTNTLEMVSLAARYRASSEGEIGVVGYSGGAQSHGTDPAEAARFAAETGVDLLAVSIGNTHLQREAEAAVDWNRAAALATIGTPLVIHGGSGIAVDDRDRLRREFGIRKFNIGTEIRQVYGAALRQTLDDDRALFDHLTIAKGVHAPLVTAARRVIGQLARP